MSCGVDTAGNRCEGPAPGGGEVPDDSDKTRGLGRVRTRCTFASSTERATRARSSTRTTTGSGPGSRPRVRVHASEPRAQLHPRGGARQLRGSEQAPYHTIIPGMATRAATGDLYAAFGVMGGFMQPQGHLQVISHMVDGGLDPQAALDMPRWCIGGVGSEKGSGLSSTRRWRWRRGTDRQTTCCEGATSWSTPRDWNARCSGGVKSSRGTSVGCCGAGAIRAGTDAPSVSEEREDASRFGGLTLWLSGKRSARPRRSLSGRAAAPPTVVWIDQQHASEGAYTSPVTGSWRCPGAPRP